MTARLVCAWLMANGVEVGVFHSTTRRNKAVRWSRVLTVLSLATGMWRVFLSQTSDEVVDDRSILTLIEDIVHTSDIQILGTKST